MATEERPEWMKPTGSKIIYRLVWQDTPSKGPSKVTLHYVRNDGNNDTVDYFQHIATNCFEHGYWVPCDRPADAIAPKYGLVAEEKPLRPEWIVEDDIFARLCWSEASDFDGKKFVPVKLAGGDGGQYIVSVIEQNLKTGAWRKADRPKDAVAPAYGLSELTGSKGPLPACDYSPIEAFERCDYDPNSMAHEIVTLRRKHAELLTLVEALLAKHDPGMLAAVRKTHG